MRHIFSQKVHTKNLALLNKPMGAGLFVDAYKYQGWLGRKRGKRGGGQAIDQFVGPGGDYVHGAGPTPHYVLEVIWRYHS